MDTPREGLHFEQCPLLSFLTRNILTKWNGKIRISIKPTKFVTKNNLERRDVNVARELSRILLNAYPIHMGTDMGSILPLITKQRDFSIPYARVCEKRLH